MRDVIIVGAGTAGSVLAERLTRSGRLQVTLIEAGGAPKNRFVSIPAGFTRLFKSEVDWAFASEPQKAVGDRRIFTPRGKMLGGSSNMNAMMHQWCHPADFDGWEAAGAAGWGWTEVSPVFREQERWCGGDDDPGRGRSGPMRIEPNRNASPLSHRFVEAARRAGLGRDTRYNGHAFGGAWIAELAHKDGKRFSTYHAYLEPAMRRANLEVVTHAHVARIVIESGRATGVALRLQGRQQTRSARAIVLAAGACGSPQILMLSGIGPVSELRKFDIPIHLDAPEVGENLQDHPVTGIVCGTSSIDTLLRAKSFRELSRYLLFKRGMLASNGVEGFAFTQIVAGPVNAPDLELMFMPFERRNEFLDPPVQHAFTIACAVVAPRSRGRVTLRSSNPLAPMSIDPALLSDPDGVDARVLCEGVRLSRKVAATSPLAEYNTGELRPGTEVQSDSGILAFASTDLQTVYHPTSTCRMGSDARSVVDSELKVRNIDGLWIVDASVMPSVPRGHPNAVVAMIANRGAAGIEGSVAQ